LTRQTWPSSNNGEDGVDNNIFDNVDIDSMIIKMKKKQEQSSFSWWRRRLQRSPLRTRRRQQQQDDSVAAERFLQYIKMLRHGGPKYVNIRRVFPNAKVLILEGVPTSWIDIHPHPHHHHGQQQQQQQQQHHSLLRVLTVKKAAIYNLDEFLLANPSSSVISSCSSRKRRNYPQRREIEEQLMIENDDNKTASAPTDLLQPGISVVGRIEQEIKDQFSSNETKLNKPEESASFPPPVMPVGLTSSLPSPSLIIVPYPSSSLSLLTHLKLESCCLGELTIGFHSCLSQLQQLTYLSLRNNEFRKAITVLKALKGLEHLQYADITNNRIMGKFGPNTNLYLSGQVHTLKLSGNLLRTCSDSGLEKCFAIQNLWLDNNLIDNVIEVSGLARLPELKSLQLQKNPFTIKTITIESALASTSTSTSTSKRGGRQEIGDNNNSNNPLYDPDWKIRLWTWFQQERRAVTPLELPILNRKEKKRI